MWLFGLAASVAWLVAQGCRGQSTPTTPTPAGNICDGARLTVTSCDVGLGYFPPADQLACPTRAELETVMREIPVRVKSDVSSAMRACRESEGSLDLSPVQFGLYRALLFLRQLQFDEPLPWTNQSLWDWLRSAIPKGIVIDYGPNAYAYLHEITLAYSYDTDWSSIDRSIKNIPFATIVHEARHAEDMDRYSHNCLWDGTRYRGDRTIAEMRATGVTYYLLLWISLHSQERPALKLWAGSFADGLGRGGLFCCECPGHATASSVSNVIGTFCHR